MKFFAKMLKKEEKGSILILVVIILFFTVTTVASMCMFCGTSMRNTQVINNKTNELYSADAGIEDAKWQINYEQLNGKFSNYDVHDYNTVWSYDLPQVNNAPQINNDNVTVTVQNVWIPKDLLANPNDVPSIAAADSIVNNSKLMVTGGSFTNVNGVPSFNIVITFTPAQGDNLKITTIGLWLPPGYTYKSNSNNLGSEPVTTAYQGGQAIAWNLGSLVFSSLPGVNPTNPTMAASINLAYYLNGNTPAATDPTPAAMAWINTSGVSGLTYCWDDAVRVLHVTSTAGNTTVDTYIPKVEIRKLGSPLSGDYYATGNSLMVDTNNDGIRDTRQDGSATVGPPNPTGADNGVPQDANISAAYLYWSAWKGEPAKTYKLNDDCSKFYTSGGNFDNGSAWSAYSYNNGSTTYSFFHAHNSNGADSTDQLTEHSALDLHSYAGSSYITTLSWDQWATSVTSVYPLNPETCDNFNLWTAGNAWSTNSGHFRGHSNSSMNLTLTNSIDLSSYTAGLATISWDQWVSSTPPGSGDGLNFELSSDGVNFGSAIQAFRGNIGTSPVHYTYTIPAQYLTANFKIRFTLVGFASSNQYAYIDNISINVPAPTYTSTDQLQFAVSADNGNTWSNYITAFTGDKIVTSEFASQVTYQYVIPASFLTSTFKVKFHISGLTGLGEYACIDNIRITVMQPSTGITFSINNGTTTKQVYFDSNGNPADGNQQLTPTKTQLLLAYYNHANDSPPNSPSTGGYAYSCYRDVTALVRKYAEQPQNGATNFNGHGTYTVKGTLGDTGDNLSFAGWSLIIIYTSPETQTHQIYLYDNFVYSGQDSTNGVHVDWDGDGSPGGYVNGFIVPQQVQGEINAAKITCFVLEGDDALTGDYFALNGTKLWDGTNSTSNSKTNPNNIWNGLSLVTGNTDGVDIDTPGIDPTASPPQYVTWASNMLHPGDTSAYIDLYTKSDCWFLAYMIFSFRSETTSGGSLNYLVQH